MTKLAGKSCDLFGPLDECLATAYRGCIFSLNWRKQVTTKSEGVDISSTKGSQREYHMCESRNNGCIQMHLAKKLNAAYIQRRRR
jgi:hypothetical protein